jgi:hypothetical protein
MTGIDAADNIKSLASAGNRSQIPQSSCECPGRHVFPACSDCTGLKFYCHCLVLYRNKLVLVFYLIVPSQDTNSGSPRN